MGFLSKDQILAAEDLPRREAAVPEWGGGVWLRTMTGAERDAFEASLLAGADGDRNLANLRARLLVRTLVDAKGNRLFADDDAGLLGEKSAAVLDRLFAIAQEINGLRAADVEELAKN